MADYIESPIGRITNVGWSTGGLGELTTKTTGSGSVIGIFHSGPFICNIAGETSAGNTWTRLFFNVKTTDTGYEPGKTLADLLSTTFTGVTSGQSLKVSDLASTFRCALTDDNKYGDGGLFAGSIINGWARMGRSQITFAGTYHVEYWSNSSLSGADDANYALWVAGEDVTVDYP